MESLLETAPDLQTATIQVEIEGASNASVNAGVAVQRAYKEPSHGEPSRPKRVAAQPIESRGQLRLIKFEREVDEMVVGESIRILLEHDPISRKVVASYSAPIGTAFWGNGSTEVEAISDIKLRIERWKKMDTSPDW